MKTKIAIVVSALLIGAIAPANADLYVQSPTGLTQAQWNATDTYKNFACPSGYARGEGVDMNFTTSRADDYWFVSCTLIVETPPRPIYVEPTPTPTPTLAQTETSTATVVSNTTPAVVAETTTTVTETTTATITSVTVQSLYAQIMALLTQLMALIAKLNG